MANIPIFTNQEYKEFNKMLRGTPIMMNALIETLQAMSTAAKLNNADDFSTIGHALALIFWLNGRAFVEPEQSENLFSRLQRALHL
jgi:hypothetical protein